MKLLYFLLKIFHLIWTIISELQSRLITCRRASRCWLRNYDLEYPKLNSYKDISVSSFENASTSLVPKHNFLFLSGVKKQQPRTCREFSFFKGVLVQTV